MPEARRSNKLAIAAFALIAAVALTGRVALAEGDSENLDYGDLGQAIAAVLIFAILLFVLGKWAWKPIVKELRRREQDIADALNRAQRREEEAQGLLNHYKARLDQAEHEARDLLADSRKEAAEFHDEIVATARSEAAQGAEKVRKELEQAKIQAIGELQTTTAQLAAGIAGEVIRKELTDGDQQRLLDVSLAEIKKLASEG